MFEKTIKSAKAAQLCRQPQDADLHFVGAFGSERADFVAAFLVHMEDTR